YSEHAPPEELAGLVVSAWSFVSQLGAGETIFHHVWPDGCTSVVVAFTPGDGWGAVIAGPVLRAHRMPVGDGWLVRGARFWPDAAGLVLGVRPTELHDRVIPVSAILGEAAADSLVARVASASTADAPAELARWLAEWLAARPGPTPIPDPRVRRAVRHIVETGGGLPITRTAAVAGLSARQLQRLFHEAVGVTPKEYARIRRMRGALAALLRGVLPQAALADALGYADQAHLARELRDLTGLTPGQLRERLGMIEHVDVTP